MRILLVDDHDIIRQGLQSLIEKQPGCKVVGETDNGRTARTLVNKLNPDLVIMDVTLPDLNGIDATRLLRTDHPRLKVLGLSMHSDSRYVIQMLKAGASGYLLKNHAAQELPLAIQSIGRGETYLSPGVAGSVVKGMLNRAMTSDRSAFAVLSEREREVLQLFAEGKSTKEIAGVLELSAKTVETHRERIRIKLGIDSIATLTKYAIREGLTTLDA